VTAWVLLGEAVPDTAAAMAGLVAAILFSWRSGHARLRRWLRLPLVIVSAARGAQRLGGLPGRLGSRPRSMWRAITID
jgi:hypothetical protein